MSGLIGLLVGQFGVEPAGLAIRFLGFTHFAQNPAEIRAEAVRACDGRSDVRVIGVQG